MAESMFNLDAIRNAAKTYFASPTTQRNDNLSAPKVTQQIGTPGTSSSPVPLSSNSSATMPTAALLAKSGSSVPKAPSKATQAAQTMVNATTNNTSTSTSVPTSRTETTLGNINNLVNSPFSYDPTNDAAYQAAVKQAQNELAINQKNTNAHLRATGQGKSSWSETVANQLANQTEENIANNILPQYAQMAYQQYQDNIANQGNLYNLQYNQDYTTPMAEAQLTGTYQKSDLTNLYNTVLQAKQNYAAAKTPEERQAANQAAEAARQQIRIMGGNPDLVGSNVTYDQALGNQNQFGIRTLAGQASDLQGKQANLDAANIVSQITGRAVTPQSDWTGLYRQAQDPNAPLTSAQQNINFNQNLSTRQQNFNEGQQNWQNNFDMTKFNEDVRRYGLDYALQQQQVGISQQNANTSRNDSNFGRLMDIWQATGVAPAGIAGVAQGTPYSSGAAQAATPVTAEEYATGYLDKSAQYDEDGKLQNSDSIERQILSSGLSEKEMYKLYQRYGIPWDGTAPN